jgi:filamentous hemagglutinin family protein
LLKTLIFVFSLKMFSMLAEIRSSQSWQWKIRGCTVFGTLLLGVSDRALAQITPDNTLSRESSIVAPDVTVRNLQSDLIEGGAIRGTNLFHSFTQFNIGAGRGAYFTNPAGINNILTRVTGANRSEVLGRLGVLGTANLFLINPNGIVFGPDASLDVQGSFTATTANAIQFPNGESFSASTPSAPSSLLTVNPSAFLFNQVPVGAITNSSRTLIGATPTGNQFGLRVADGRSLLLLGGNIVMDGGGAIARGGRIELGAIAESGTVGLNMNGNDLSLSFPGGVNKADISLNNGALVSVNGERGGDIQVQGRRITVDGGSQITTVTLGAGTGGTLAVRAEDAIEVIGTSADGRLSSGLFTSSQGIGNAGNLTINTQRLRVQGGAQISANTRGQGKGGSLQVTAEDAIEVSGQSADGQRISRLSAQSQGSGDAGNLTIETQRLRVQDNAQVSVSTFDSGKGGSLRVTADTVELIGTSSDGQTLSGLFASSQGSGDAGNLTIETQRLLVQGGTQVSVSTFNSGKGGSLQVTADVVELFGTSANGRFPSGLFASSQGSGDAGNLTINTRRLFAQSGAQVGANASSSGKGGSLLITAEDAIELFGTSANGRLPSGLFARSQGNGDAGNLTINTQRLRVQDGAQVSLSTRGQGRGGSLQVTANAVELIGTSADGRLASGLFTSSQGSGDAGNLTIETQRLLVQDGAFISSRSVGKGTAGSIDITARDTLQARRGTIGTDSAQTQGGTITIQAGKIRLFDNSDIRSNVASGADNGGTITLSASSIVALNDSDIVAFARTGRGGDITLNTPAFFGENYRPAPRGTNPDTLDRNNQVDINATGAISGIITIPDVSFIQNSLTELPDNQINTDTLLANSCIVRTNQLTRGSFIVTGTGSLPQRPGEPQTSSFPTVSVETLPSDDQTSSLDRAWRKGDPIVEPQGVYRLPSGKIVLSRKCS